VSKFNGNIRTTKVLDDTALREALRGGWDKALPAIKDEFDNLLVGNRRMKIALKEGIEPVIKVVKFGTGPDAEAARIRLANVSNIGGAPLTVEDRQRQAERLAKSGLVQEEIAQMLGVSQSTIRDDLRNFNLVGTTKLNEAETRPARTARNPKGAGRPKGSGKSNGKGGTKATKAKEKPAKEKPAPTLAEQVDKFHNQILDFQVEFYNSFVIWLTDKPELSEDLKNLLITDLKDCAKMCLKLSSLQAPEPEEA
jgi:DNA-binding CsgD family transcriptional regulator